MSTLVLKKNDSLNLSKAIASLTKYVVGLSWDANTDLDAVAVCLDQNGKLITPDTNNIAYYGNCTKNKFKNAENPVPGLTHSGDARDGSAAGDDETITVDTLALRADVAKVVIAVTSYTEGEPTIFGAASHPVAKLYDQNNKVLFEVKLAEDAPFSTAIAFVEFYKENGDWKVKHLSQSLNGCSANGLVDVLNAYQ